MNIFQQLFRMREFCMAVRSTQIRSIDIFSTTIPQGSVATHLRGGGIFYFCFTTTNLLLSVKNFENRSAFGKVSSKNLVAPFCWILCSICGLNNFTLTKQMICKGLLTSYWYMQWSSIHQCHFPYHTPYQCIFSCTMAMHYTGWNWLDWNNDQDCLHVCVCSWRHFGHDI